MKRIEYQDQGMAAEVIDLAYNLLSESEKLPEDPQLRTEHVGRRTMCINASDAVTRAAYTLGILASREGHGSTSPSGVEGHDNIGHYITSFGALEEPPQETDPIICLTWGQFNPDQFIDRRRAYFGPRVGILQLVGINNYRSYYSSSSAVIRQITYTPSGMTGIRNLWLRTKPEDFKDKAYPLGQVAPTDFPAQMWDYPAFLPQPR
jgi:hypothetical protein